MNAAVASVPAPNIGELVSNPARLKELSADRRRRLVTRLVAMILVLESNEDALAPPPATERPEEGRGPPRGGDQESERTERIRPLTDEELGRFLAAAEKHEPRCAAYFWALAYAGLRPGEGLALQEADLDLDQRVIHIRRAISDGDVGSTKTGQIRTVGLSRALERRLRVQLRWRKEEKLARGWAEVFTTTGTPLDIHNTAKAFKRCLKEAGIESPHSPYDLRHGFATNLLAKGAPLTYVAAQLGHRKPTTTLRWYAHWMPSNDSASPTYWAILGTTLAPRCSR